MPENKGQVVDFNVELVNFNGEKLKDEKEKIVKLKKVCADSLLSQDISGGDETARLKQFELARKVHNSEEPIELSSEEAQTIRKCVNKGHDIFVFGLICDYIK